MQLDLPVIVGDPIPIQYVLMDGTGVPVVKTETAGRVGKTEGDEPLQGSRACLRAESANRSYASQNADRQATAAKGAFTSAKFFAALSPAG